MAKTGEHPRVRLACIHDERYREYVIVATTTTRYSLCDIPVSRPATGLVEATVACASCGIELPVRVFSPAKRRRWKLGWFGLFLLGVLIAAPSISRLVSLDSLDEPLGLPYVLPMLTNVLGLGAAAVGGLFFFTEDGVRLTTLWGGVDHRLRRW